MCDKQIQKAIDGYIQSRVRLLLLGKQFPHRIGGNDNIIGRIGEFIALQYLEGLQQKPKKVAGRANPGYDLVEGGRRTQVKVITTENDAGRTVRLKKPWNQLVLIELGKDYRPIRIGILTAQQHMKARTEDARHSPEPYVKLTMLNANGLIGKYGSVVSTDRLYRRRSKAGRAE